jgi:hypothetical protein
LANQANFTAIEANNGGPVVFDSSVTIHSGSGGTMSGNIISYANIIIDANNSFGLAGFDAIPPFGTAAPFINRGTITVPASRSLTLMSPFVNEGQITVSGGSVIATTVAAGSPAVTFNWSNTGTIDLTGGGRLTFKGTGSNSVQWALHTADFGNIIDSGGIVDFDGDVLLDNSNATLTLHGTSQWQLFDGTITGGTIQVPSTASFEGDGGVETFGARAVLKDLTVNGNTKIDSNGTLTLVGDLSFNGSVIGSSNAKLNFGDSSRYPNVPVHIHEGIIDIGTFGTLITGSSIPPSITLDLGVELRGRNITASVAIPITNQGTIVADEAFATDIGDFFSFSAAPITNAGMLSAVNKAKLTIANLAAPNSGTVSAAAGSSVAFTGVFSQASTGTVHADIAGTATTQFGLIAITGAATLSGTLDVKFATGFTPAVGSTYKVMTYGSHSGQFATVNVTGLASGLAVTPQYNGTDLTLLVSSAPTGMVVVLNQTALTATQSSTPAIALGDELFAGFSKEAMFFPTAISLTPIASCIAPRPTDGVESISGAAADSSTIPRPMTEPGLDSDTSAATDEVFAGIDRELL